MPATPNVYKTQKAAQEAHEAIRPTSAARDPESIRQYVEPDVHKLYQLIWNRFIASQMVPAILDVTRVDSSPVMTRFSFVLLRRALPRLTGFPSSGVTRVERPKQPLYHCGATPVFRSRISTFVGRAANRYEK